MLKTRAETDSLGAIEVPAEALYGAQTVGGGREFSDARLSKDIFQSVVS